MDKFKKLVAIEPVNMVPEARPRLEGLAGSVVMYDDIPCTTTYLHRLTR